MFCRQCGAQIPDDSAFCPICGEDLRAAAALKEEAAASAVPEQPVAVAVAPAQPVVPVAPPTAPVTAPPTPAPPVAVTAPVGTGYPKASLGARFLALFADSIIGGALMPLAILFLFQMVQGGDEQPVLFLVAVAIGSLWQIGYFFAKDVAGGAGPGKRLAGLAIVSTQTGTIASGGSTFVRQLIWVLTNIVPGIGSLIEPIVVLADKDGRRLGDKAAKTQVVAASELVARGVIAPRKKTGAVIFLVAAIVVSLVASVIGGVLFARLAYSSTDWEYEIGSEFDYDTGIDEGIEGEDPLVTDEPAEDDSIEAIFTQEAAVDAVGNLLNELKEDNPEGAKQYATEFFYTEYDWFFEPTAGSFVKFEVVDVYRDAALWAVTVNEEWYSGPITVIYFVTYEDGRVLVNDAVDADY